MAVRSVRRQADLKKSIRGGRRKSLNSRIADDIIEHQLWVDQFGEGLGRAFQGMLVESWREVGRWFVENGTRVDAEGIDAQWRERIVAAIQQPVRQAILRISARLFNELAQLTDDTMQAAANALGEQLPAEIEGLIGMARLEAVSPELFYSPPPAAQIDRLVGSAGNLADTWKSLDLQSGADIRRFVRSGIAAGEGMDQIATRARDFMLGEVRAGRRLAVGVAAGGPRTLHERVLAITRTEVQRVSNAALDETYNRPESRRVLKGKQWIATLDERCCFPAGTMVMTPDGEVPIDTLRRGDWVIGGSGIMRQVTDTMSRRYVGQMNEIAIGHRTLCATADHPIGMRAGWERIGEVEIGHRAWTHSECDEVLVSHEVLVTSIKSELVQWTKAFRSDLTVFDITVDEDHSFFAEGVLVHNCNRCAELDGKVFDLDEPMPPRPLHPRCLVGETPVFAAGKQAAFVAAYSGPVVEITLSDGRRLTGTVNHMLLTAHGFARLDSLREGDHVLDCLGLERIVAADPDNDRQPTRIDDLVESLSKLRGMSSARVPVSAEYLHGDGRFCEGDIHVVAPDGFLGNALKATGRQHPDGAGLDPRALAEAFYREGDLAPVLEGLANAADGIMGGRREILAFVRRHTMQSHDVRCAASPHGDSPIFQTKADAMPGDSERLRQSQLGFASEVSASYLSIGQGAARSAKGGAALLEDPMDHLVGDTMLFRQILDALSAFVAPTKIIGVRKHDFSGHVYDLQTASSLYIANGIVSSNCRCTAAPVTKSWEELGLPGGVEPSNQMRRTMTGEVPAKTTFPEWFAGQKADRQLRILGKGRTDMYVDSIKTAASRNMSAPEAADQFFKRLVKRDASVVTERKIPEIRALLKRSKAFGEPPPSAAKPSTPIDDVDANI